MGSGIWVLLQQAGTGTADGLGTAKHLREEMGHNMPALRYLDQVGCWSPSLLKVLLPMLLLHFEGKARAQDPLGTGGDGVCVIWPLSPQFLQGRRRWDSLPSPTHGGQRKEGDAEQGKASRQHPSQPRLRCLVPVADGGEGDLPGGRAGGGLEGAPLPQPYPTLLVPSRGWGAAVAELTVPHHRESA